MQSINNFPYFSDIEETFVRRRGSGFFLSPKDWALIESWQVKGVPLHIALRAIESVFDSRDQKQDAGRISSLAYCASAVDQQYAEWLTAHVGSGEAAEPVETDWACGVCGKEYCLSLHRD